MGSGPLNFCPYDRWPVRGYFACGRVSFWTPRKKPKRRSGAAAGSDSSAFAPSSSTAAPLRTPGDAAGAAPGRPGACVRPAGDDTPQPPYARRPAQLGDSSQPPPTGGLPGRGLVPAGHHPAPFGLRPFPPDRGNRPLDKGRCPQGKARAGHRPAPASNLKAVPFYCRGRSQTGPQMYAARRGRRALRSCNLRSGRPKAAPTADFGKPAGGASPSPTIKT